MLPVHASLEFGLGVSYTSLEVIPYLVGSYFDLLPCCATGLPQFLYFFGRRTLFGRFRMELVQ
jgi:hypothetical protein